MRNLDLNLLTLFLALHDEGTVSGAGRKLGMSQPAVSAGLSRMRESFADQLFVRTGRGMAPTLRAVQMLGPVREAIEIIKKEVLNAAEFTPSTAEEVFTVAMSDVSQMVLLPPILKVLGREAPGTSIRAVTPSRELTERGLEQGDINVAIGYYPDLKGNNFYQQRLFSSGFACLLRREHPIKARKLSTKQFLELGHAVVRAEGRSQEVFDRYLARHGLQLRIVLRTAHFLSIPGIVAQSDLVATVPEAVAMTFSAMSELRIMRPPFDIPRFDMRTHWHRKFHNDPANRWFRGVVASLFNDQTEPWKKKS
jgi:DNA-binding transcriptional LysR family regulator